MSRVHLMTSMEKINTIHVGTPDVFSTTSNRFLFTYYSLTVCVKNALAEKNTYYHSH